MKKLPRFLTKAGLSLLVLGAAFTQSKAINNGDADPAIDIVMMPPSVFMNNTSVLKVSLSNNGLTTDIVANSLAVTVSVGNNAQILGIIPDSSSANWTQFFLTNSNPNTITMTNTNGGLPVSGQDVVYLLVQSTVALPNQNVSASIQYFSGNNALLGGLPNNSQGDLRTLNDNATTGFSVTNPPPDFTPEITIDATSFAAGQSRDFTVGIYEVNNQPGSGQVAFRLPKGSAFTYTFNPTATTAGVSGGTAVNNADWNITQTSGYILCTLKPGKTIGAYGLSYVGFTVTRNAGVAINTTQNITAIIVPGSGGDSDNTDNTNSTTLTATTTP